MNDYTKRFDQDIPEILPVTYDGHGYPCFVKTARDQEMWNGLESKWKDVYVDRYTYLQEEYGTPDPTLGEIQTAVTFGF